MLADRLPEHRPELRDDPPPGVEARHQVADQAPDWEHVLHHELLLEQPRRETVQFWADPPSSRPTPVEEIHHSHHPGVFQGESGASDNGPENIDDGNTELSGQSEQG